ncbi:MAG: hypothetical protein E3J72_06020 [Planctomycetota bacterium]|nr:MAG: hypothetical protein E3J72_06020 [Planctomycetota bacterium]
MTAARASSVKRRASSVKRRSGYILLPTVIVFSATVLAMTAMFVTPIYRTQSLIRQRTRLYAARNLADAGAAKAIHKITQSGPEFTGKGSNDLPTGSCEWKVEKKKDGDLLVTAEGKHNFPDAKYEIAVVEITVSVGKKSGGKFPVSILSIKRGVSRK